MFLCFQGYKPPDEGPSEYQTIPLNKIEDFGVHCKQWEYLVEAFTFDILEKNINKKKKTISVDLSDLFGC